MHSHTLLSEKCFKTVIDLNEQTRDLCKISYERSIYKPLNTGLSLLDPNGSYEHQIYDFSIHWKKSRSEFCWSCGFYNQSWKEL